MTLPRIETYGRYKSGNYGAHCLVVSIPREELPDIKIWFSYETPIAFREDGRIVCRENEWGPTTGKHMRWIGVDKKDRVSREEFERRFYNLLNGHPVGLIREITKARK